MKCLLVALLCLAGCGRPASSSIETTGELIDVVDSGMPTSDAGARVTYEAQIQPLLYGKCSRCHESGNLGLPSIGDQYSALFQPSTLCSGERVGDCVKYALQAQVPEGTGCRTIIVRPFHREPWRCLSTDEIDLVVGWVDDGMPQR